MEAILKDYNAGFNIFQLENKYKIKYSRIIEIIHYMEIGRYKDTSKS